MSNATLEDRETTAPAQPPEETVWQRYSAHNEGPLSSVASLLLHVLAIGLVVLLGIVASMFGFAEKKKAPIEMAQLDSGDGLIPGAPGTPGGPPVKNQSTQPREDIKTPATRQEEPLPPRERLDPAQIASLPQEIQKDVWVQEYLDRGSVNLDLLNRIGTKIRLADPPANPGAGPGGQGPDQGPGNGGQGGQGGMGGQKGDLLTKREKRNIRWKMMFDTRSAKNYVDQLDALGAILGIPTTPQGGDYRLVRNLKKVPAELLVEDWSKLGLIQWTDGNSRSALDVARTLGIPPITHFIAFMPRELELKLTDLEKRYRGLEEDQIFETIFRVDFVGGRYEPVVVSQTPNRGMGRRP